MIEPPSHREQTESAFIGQMSTCIKQLRNPVLLWISLFVVAMTVFNLAIFLHPLVVVLLLLRSTPRAVMVPIINATVHPHLNSSIRATFLSLQSFAGRLSFVSALFATFVFTSGQTTLKRYE